MSERNNSMPSDFRDAAAVERWLLSLDDAAREAWMAAVKRLSTAEAVASRIAEANKGVIEEAARNMAHAAAIGLGVGPIPRPIVPSTAAVASDDDNLLAELRGPFNACCYKKRCVARIETLERENLELQHDIDRVMANHNADLNAAPSSTKCTSVDSVNAIVNRFLAWPLPDSVCSDPCASMPGYKGRIGTNLLNSIETRQMLTYVLQPILDVLNDALYSESGCKLDDPMLAAKTIAAEYALLKERLFALSAAGVASRDEIIEECAKVCDREAAIRHWPEYRDTAERIRALKNAAPQGSTGTAPDGQELKELVEKPDSKIDFSDVPEIAQWTDVHVGRFYKPLKKTVTPAVAAPVVPSTDENGKRREAMREFLRPSEAMTQALDAATEFNRSTGGGTSEPIAWMWQHPETGMKGFIEHCSEEDRRHWERINRPRQIVRPVYDHVAPSSKECTPGIFHLLHSIREKWSAMCARYERAGSDWHTRMPDDWPVSVTMTMGELRGLAFVTPSAIGGKEKS